ncbi:TonB-dependent receptor [Mariniflexile litorale]|uniref:TonB-dependent receptor n=1 Tax=Mariniflexile litorale TaxID=3045158 RepID=A0AAU7EKD4_9FLAO|nr:TonB-dependent receptor [Mariniflexile sp. KMM 9835]MDQ8210663.1 TonB-dependent receptor [Mariniflexile sp. KMM 9835]
MKTKLNFKYCFLLLGIIFYLPIHGQNTSIVKGIISDEFGIPLPGVSVIVKNTTKGTATDFDGNYSIAVNANDVLVFSFLGYKTQEIAVKGQSTIDLNLLEDKNVLDEVVVIGYGSTTRRDVTGSIASVSAADIVKAPVANVAQAIQGQLPGVRITTQDGRPGASISIRVRGGGSISQSNQPLIIVDGFPVDNLDNIPGNQIQSIDVLKDASSTAIYGARGANGVVIVTTKSGKSGKPKVTYDGYTQFSTIPEYLPVMNGYEYIKYNWAYASAIAEKYSEAWERMWNIGNYSGSNPEGIEHYRNVESRDYTKELFNSAFTYNHNFNISGGSDNTKYLLAFNQLDQEGNKVASYFKRTNVSLKLDQKLGDKINLTFNTRFSQTSEGDNDGDGDAYYFRPINFDDILGDSVVTSNTLLGDYQSLIYEEYSPIADLLNNQTDGKKRNLVANTGLSWEIVNGLTVNTELSLTNSWSDYKKWEGGPRQSFTDPITGEPTQGKAEVKLSQGWNYRWANTLNYQVQGLGDAHKLSALAGYEVADSGGFFSEVKSERFPLSYDAERAWNNMQGYFKDSEDGSKYHSYKTEGKTPSRLQSLFGRLNYGFNDKYLITATFRADGSSRFAPTNQWGYFPAGAIAWRASEEDFLKDVSWLDDLKVRFSYGTVGSDGINAELWKQNWAAGEENTFSINENIQPIYEPATGQLANPNLKWETTITRNLGFDYTLFNGKLSGAVELYKNTVKDLLIFIPTSPFTSFTDITDNIGQTSNKGIEVSFRGDIINSEDFNLRGSFNINFNKGNVDELSSAVDGRYGNYLLEVGSPVGLIRGYKADGIYTTSDFDYNPVNQEYTIKPGVVDIGDGVIANIYGTIGYKPGSQTAYPGVQKYKDISGPDGSGPDGIVDINDKGIIGDTNPIHTGGFSLSGNYRAFDFGADFAWSYGNDIVNSQHRAAYTGSKESGLFRNRIKELTGHYKIYDVINGQMTRITEPAALDALNVNATTYLPYGETGVFSDYFVEDGSYLRLNTLTLGYTLPESATNKFGLDRIRFYGSVYNVFTLTGYSGFDPEINVDDNDDDSKSYPTPGDDSNAYPRPRTFTFGVNIEF